MDFFASQDLARRNTRKLVVLLAITLVCLIACVYVLAMVAGQFARSGPDDSPLFGSGWINLPVLGIVSIVVSAIVGGGSMIKIAELRSGGEKVASLLGGRRLLPGSTDLSERKVLNVVEEMAIASGIPVPPVYVLDGEPGINAFAAGHSIDDAVIGVNRGTIEQLNRDELQGVIAHEYSHILNGDMRMSLRLIGILHGVQAIALIGWAILRTVGNSRRSSSSKKEGGGVVAVLAVGAGLLAIGSIGLFFARLIKASISRQREYLADASAVQFTRNPESIGNALKMIGASGEHSRMRAAGAESISHMFFANMTGSLLAGLFSTHPPLVPRIQRVDPQFGGDFAGWARERARREARRQADPAGEEAAKKQKEAALAALGMIGRMGSEGGALARGLPLDPALLVAAVGSPTDDDMVFSRALVGNVPAGLLDAIRDVYLARCVVFASLLDPDTSGAELRQRQCDHLVERHGAATLEDTLRIEPLVRAAETRWRLPVFEIVQGSLVGLSPPQYQVFRESVTWLMESDGRVSLFEFFLQHHLITHLNRHFGLRPLQKTRFERMDQLVGEAEMLLDMLVKNGDRDPADRERALQAAVRELPAELHGRISLRGKNPTVSELNSALDRMALSSPPVRKQFLSAAATAIAVDRQISVSEAELFRALGEALDCPVPPLIAGSSEE